MDGTYMCLNTYQSEDEEYGLDFLASKIYTYRDGYMHSTENGSDVMIDEEELQRNWLKVN